MALEVIGAGFGRTGTTSLKVALEELGFAPCYHMTEVFEYRPTVDWPSAAFYKELMDRYPDAKVILTVRDPDRWHESTRTTIYGMSRSLLLPAVLNSGCVRAQDQMLKRCRSYGVQASMGGYVRGRFEDKEHAIKVFEGWNEEAKERVPTERLLVYEGKEGWGPLCGFLGVEAPDKPFPHLNDAEVFRGRIRRIRRLTVTMVVFGVTLVGLVPVCFRRHRRV
jgi:hypothetical protein